MFSTIARLPLKRCYRVFSVGFILSRTVIGDIFGRFRKLVQTIKNNPNYTETIGDNLGITGAEPPTGGMATSRAEMKPTVTQTLQSGHPRLKWKKNKMQGVKIMVDRGTGTFAMLAIDTKTYYLDTFALPAVGASAVWKYMFIYQNDTELFTKKQIVL